MLLAPIFSGKGTRYKILEALASNLAIVATETAVEGLNLQNKNQVLTGCNAQELANLAVEVLNNSQKRKKMSDEGKKFVNKFFSWPLISEKLNQLYLEIGKNNDKN
jgi:glycosyltransferase involved in cell wall biosynthesis